LREQLTLREITNMSNGNDMAFPVVLETTRTPNDSEQLGLTKREYFAAMAMQGLLATETADDSFTGTTVAKRSVAFADALLARLAE
jgi:hypothetical protein